MLNPPSILVALSRFAPQLDAAKSATLAGMVTRAATAQARLHTMQRDSGSLIEYIANLAHSARSARA